MNTCAPLHGLVLAGGESRRMGRDKAALDYAGRTQLEVAFERVSRHCEQAWISVRAAQAHDPVRAALPRIVDGTVGQGPIAGIAAAQAEHPDAAWLVVACDLPFLDDTTLEFLVAARGRGPVTAFRSARDGLPEPLCAIYEPETREAILEFVGAGRHCPRKFILSTSAPLLELPHGAALDNVNTPEEYAAARTRLGAGAGA